MIIGCIEVFKDSSAAGLVFAASSAALICLALKNA